MRKIYSILIVIGVLLIVFFAFRCYLGKSIESALSEEFGKTKEAKNVQRKSIAVIVARSDLQKGQLVKTKDLAKKNVSIQDIASTNVKTYISAEANIETIIGRTLKTNVKKGIPLTMSDFKNE